MSAGCQQHTSAVLIYCDSLLHKKMCYDVTI